MVRTTKAQRKTLKRKCIEQNRGLSRNLRTLVSYRAFRRTVETLLGGNGCIMVPWCGMWLGIETDGYAHT